MKAILMVTLWFVCESVLAASAWHTTKVESLFIDTRSAGDPAYPSAQRYSGCAVKPVSHPKNSVAGCTGRLIALGCDGLILSYKMALNSYQNAQLAYVVDKEIGFWLDDSIQQNGNCVATSTAVTN